jgi:dUTP pyrophosphatase
MIKVFIKNTSQNPLPAYATAGSAGLDIRAWLPEPVTLKPLERNLIATGIFLQIPDGYEAQVRPRSGLAVQKGITCLNTPGTIDSDYRGEVKVLLINLGQEAVTIASGERIAQMVFAPVTRVEWEETKTLEESVRGAGGFGHTGTS